MGDGVRTALHKLHSMPRPSADGKWSLVAGGRTHPPYYVQMYHEGSVCEETKQRRSIEVRIFCATDRKQHNSFTVRERATCRYILSFTSVALCNWPEMAA
eukprot:NODE_9104_length_382_cov_37.309309_g8206_i0.p1 GENE.NODE_9104_length_382_cov_37.309309_g8206_i0~~NODE_9104_length_382_cov_37.309309_g8206_i0.p1  ORF type:complete len:108 (+),score=24.00 NODE_9104_length_382_cov_37.309309_g8206_i0:27-326(+)